MKKTINDEINEWWNKFDLIEKILIKDFIDNLCNGDEIKKQKLLDALIKKIRSKEYKWAYSNSQ